MEKTYDYYVSLPKLDDNKIKSLIKSDEEVNAFLDECYEYKKDPDYDEECGCFCEHDMGVFVGEEFLAATEQPQHFAIDPNNAILERIHWYYPKLFEAFVEDSGMGRPMDWLTSRRQDFLKSSTRYRAQFLNMLYKINMSEEEFWKRYTKNLTSYWFNLRLDLYHTQRELPKYKDRAFAMMHYGEWITNMLDEIIDNEYTYSLNLMAGAN